MTIAYDTTPVRTQLKSVNRDNEFTHIGAFYVNSADMSDRVTIATRSLLKSFVMSEYLKMTNDIDVIYSPVNKYETLAELSQDIENNTLTVFTGSSDDAFFNKRLNLMFRAVHDYHHYHAQAEINLSGEMEAYKYCINALKEYFYGIGLKDIILLKQACSVLYSEIVLQSYACDYLGYFEDKQKVVLTTAPHTGLY